MEFYPSQIPRSKWDSTNSKTQSWGLVPCPRLWENCQGAPPVSPPFFSSFQTWLGPEPWSKQISSLFIRPIVSMVKNWCATMVRPQCTTWNSRKALMAIQIYLPVGLIQSMWYISKHLSWHQGPSTLLSSAASSNPLITNIRDNDHNSWTMPLFRC